MYGYVPFSSPSNSKNRFKVYLRDGMEHRFKQTMKSYDKTLNTVSLVQDKIGFFYVETEIDQIEIQGFTSVKNVYKLNFLEEV